MSTRGHSLEHPVLIAGRVATTVVDRAPVPLILLGPRTLAPAPALRITLGSQVRTLDGQRLGEVHRVLVDLTQNAVVGIVVLSRSVLARDISVPFDFLESGGDDEVQLRLTREQVSALPDFAYREHTTHRRLGVLPFLRLAVRRSCRDASVSALDPLSSSSCATLE